MKTAGNDIGRSSHGVMKAKEAFEFAYVVLRQAVMARRANPAPPRTQQHTPTENNADSSHLYLEAGR